MSKQRLMVRLTAGCLVAWGSVSAALAATPTVEQMLAFRPEQDAVQITTPTPAEYASCKVEAVKGPGTYSGWLLRDSRGQSLRKFGASKGPSAPPDTYSYYLDGQEVYRELDSNGDGKKDTYRWFGAGGMRWGMSTNQDTKINYWRQISAEEVSQEILRAVVSRNMNRLRALLPNENELKALELSAQEMTRINESMSRIPAKFQETVTKLGQLGENTHWLHLETSAPQCIPAEAFGGKNDLVGYSSGTIVYESNGKAEFVQTGEMLRIGASWRLVGGPAPGHDMESMANNKTPGQISLTENLKPLIDALSEHDKKAPTTGDAVAIARYNLQRADILNRIAGEVAKTSPKESKDFEQWVRQVADCLSAACQSNNADTTTTAYKALVGLRDKYVKSEPAGSRLAGYIVYREMSAKYSQEMITPPQGEGGLAKVQEGWRDRLKKFVDDYPNAEDAPDALMNLGMISEFVNKETEAKNYYQMLVTRYGDNTLAPKAQGAYRRLNADGTVFDLSSPTLGAGQAFNIASLRGKVVVVYYWASWNQQCAADFFKLKALLSAMGGQGLELVCVSLDNAPADAEGFIKQTQAPGTHLFQAPGGLDSPLAVQYGVMVLPNLFLVGRDGKVVSHTVQMSGLEDEVKKLMENKDGK